MKKIPIYNHIEHPNMEFIPYVKCKSESCAENYKGICTIPYVDLKIDYFGKCVFYNPNVKLGG